MTKALWIPPNAPPLAPSRLPIPTWESRQEDGLLLLRDRGFEDKIRQGQPASVPFRCYVGSGDMSVIVSHQPTRQGNLLHVSVAYPDHLPPWSILKSVKKIFFGDDRDAMQVLPRQELWYNCHPYCLHLLELPEVWEIWKL